MKGHAITQSRSNWATDGTTDESIPSICKRVFSENFQTPSGAQPQRVLAVLSKRVKQLQREAGHSPPSTARIQNVCGVMPPVPLCPYEAQGNYFTFTLLLLLKESMATRVRIASRSHRNISHSAFKRCGYRTHW